MPVAEPDTTYVKIKAKHHCVYEHMLTCKGLEGTGRGHAETLTAFPSGGQVRPGRAAKDTFHSCPTYLCVEPTI